MKSESQRPGWDAFWILAGVVAVWIYLSVVAFARHDRDVSNLERQVRESRASSSSSADCDMAQLEALQDVMEALEMHVAPEERSTTRTLQSMPYRPEAHEQVVECAAGAH